MTLKEWMAAHRKTDQSVALLLGVTQAAVSRYKHAKRRPRYEVARKIVEITGGAVTLEELLSTPASA